MYENTINRDLLKSELDYRIGRIRTDVSTRRRRRLVARRRDAGETGWPTR